MKPNAKSPGLQSGSITYAGPDGEPRTFRWGVLVQPLPFTKVIRKDDTMPANTSPAPREIALALGLSATATVDACVQAITQLLGGVDDPTGTNPGEDMATNRQRLSRPVSPEIQRRLRLTDREVRMLAAKQIDPLRYAQVKAELSARTRRPR